METMRNFIFLSSKITADGDYRPEIKRYLLLGRKAMTNLDRILKSRDITLPTNVHVVKIMIFPVVMYGCESCIIKKTECWRTDDFELCWKRHLRVPILKEINPDYLLEGLILRLKSPILWPPNAKSNSWENILMLGNIEGKYWRRRGIAEEKMLR